MVLLAVLLSRAGFGPNVYKSDREMSRLPSQSPRAFEHPLRGVDSGLIRPASSRRRASSVVLHKQDAGFEMMIET